MRSVLFLSHANPEDNRFTHWLALQLAAAGYRVWSDLTDLLGGEDIWGDAERVIRSEAVKLLYVLSHASNSKQGPLKELQVAENIQRDEGLTDFIIPLLVDALPHRSMNIQIARLNAVSFYASWARGLAQLLEKLERDAIPRDAIAGRELVTASWRSRQRQSPGVRADAEQVLSNVFPLERSLRLYFHELQDSATWEDLKESLVSVRWPRLVYRQYLVTLAPWESFADGLEEPPSVVSHRLTVGTRVSRRRRFWSEEEEWRAVVQLLASAWRQFIAVHGLPVWSFASGGEASYFPNQRVPKNRVPLPHEGKGRTPSKAVVGFRSLRAIEGSTRRRWWHYALEARVVLWPKCGFALKGHVVFSSDGVNLWTNPQRMHRARRAQCRNWWNQDWRDRMLGTAKWLSHGSGRLRLPVGSRRFIMVSARPIEFCCPVSYDEPGRESNEVVLPMVQAATEVGEGVART